MSRIIRVTISLALMLCALGIQAVKVLAEPAENQSYAWSGEVLRYDEKAKTVTVIDTHERRTQAIARIVIGG